MDREHLFVACIFAAVASAAYGIARLALCRTATGPGRRLRPFNVDRPVPKGVGARLPTVIGSAARFVGRPFEPRTEGGRSSLRRDLGYAGFYSASAIQFMNGARSLSLVTGLLAGYFSGRSLGNALLGIVVGVVIGFLGPRFWLTACIRRQRAAIARALPDALDLMVVCVEAGLSIDAAVQRVGREISRIHPVLGRELAMAQLEMQMGLPRGEALRNLGRRTGFSALQSLAAMLIQAERLGTGIAHSLRIHAEGLRVKQYYATEEMAAKAGVRIMLPLIICIFPAILVVVAAPAVIRIMNSEIFR